MFPLTSKLKDKIFYGWVIVVAGLIIGLAGLGARYSFGVFFKSIEGDFGLTRAATSGVFSVNMVIAGAVCILGGKALDRYGPKIVILAMGLFTALSLILTSFATSSWQLYLTYGLLFALGSGVIFSVVNATISRWFIRRRGIAVGLGSSGGPAGAVVMAPFATFLISSFGWRTASIVMGLVVGVVMVSMSLLLKKNPADMGLLPDGVKPENAGVSRPEENQARPTTGLTLTEAIRTANFWFLGIIWLLMATSIQAILTHVVPYAIDLGISPMDASIIISLMGIGAIVGRLVGGRISDALGRIVPGIIYALLLALVIFLIVWIRELWLFYAFALVFGFFWGGSGIAVTVLISDQFGIRSVGAIMGALEIGWSLGSAIGPAIVGAIFDIFGSYSIAFVILAVAMALVSLFIFLIKLKTKKTYQ